MKEKYTRNGSILLAASLALILSGCAYEANVAGDAGAATGAASHGKKMVSSFKPFKSFATETSEGNRDLNKADFIGHCLPHCDNGRQPGVSPQFCHLYCDCTYEAMRTQVPVLNLRDFGLGRSNPSEGLINRIVGQCATNSKIEGAQPPKAVLVPAGNPQTNTMMNTQTR